MTKSAPRNPRLKINVVDAVSLYDTALNSEYYAIGVIVKNAVKAKRRGAKPSKLKIPKEYVVGKGHLKFFYDKAKYLFNRFAELIEERENRGMVTDENYVLEVKRGLGELIGTEYWNDYYATDDALKLNLLHILHETKRSIKCQKFIR